MRTLLFLTTYIFQRCTFLNISTSPDFRQMTLLSELYGFSVVEVARPIQLVIVGKLLKPRKLPVFLG